MKEGWFEAQRTSRAPCGVGASSGSVLMHLGIVITAKRGVAMA